MRIFSHSVTEREDISAVGLRSTAELAPETAAPVASGTVPEIDPYSWPNSGMLDRRHNTDSAVHARRGPLPVAKQPSKSPQGDSRSNPESHGPFNHHFGAIVDAANCRTRVFCEAIECKK